MYITVEFMVLVLSRINIASIKSENINRGLWKSWNNVETKTLKANSVILKNEVGLDSSDGH